MSGFLKKVCQWLMASKVLLIILKEWKRNIQVNPLLANALLPGGNLVVMHGFQQWPGDSDYGGIDIFRFDDNGKIIEHWDVLRLFPQPLPMKMAYSEKARFCQTLVYVRDDDKFIGQMSTGSKFQLEGNGLA